MARIGLFHPGEMGRAVGLTLKNSGHEILWASEGRGSRSRERAERAGFQDGGTLAALSAMSDVIVSVCPPEFARDVAESVSAAGFHGLYADVNATAPNTKQQIARRIEAAGGSFVDGGILGRPTDVRGHTWVCLSGAAASDVASLFTAGPLEVEVLGTEIGKASALKMCFAAWTKGSTALAAAVFGTARQMDVLDDLKRSWARNGKECSVIEEDILRAAPKAWRFIGEMREIAATFEAAGLPGGFHRAAEDVYEHLADLKDASSVEMDDVLIRLGEAVQRQA